MARGKNAVLKFENIVVKKNEKNPKTALDQMQRIMEFINKFAYIMGMEFTNDWKINGRTSFAALLILFPLFCCFYTFHVTFPSNENIILIGGVSFLITVWTKIIFIALNHDKYMSVVKFIFEVVEGNLSGPRHQILLNMIKKIKYHLKINITAFLSGLVFYSAFPCYDYIFNRNLTLVSPALVPFVDPKRLQGYFITTALNLLIAVFCVNICLAISCLFFTMVDAYDGLVSLIENDFETFDEMCEKGQRGKMSDMRFRNIMMGLADLARYSAYTHDLYGVISTVQICTSYVVVVACIGGFFVSGYVGGIGGGMVFYTELLMFCYMGQLLDNTNKRIVKVICHSKWYTYEVKYQKDMITALFIAQNQLSICLADVFPLNFDTGLKITNNIYSIIMFMINMFG